MAATFAATSWVTWVLGAGAIAFLTALFATALPALTKRIDAWRKSRSIRRNAAVRAISEELADYRAKVEEWRRGIEGELGFVNDRLDAAERTLENVMTAFEGRDDPITREHQAGLVETLQAMRDFMRSATERRSRRSPSDE